ncbi:hypothetical protein B9T24_04245 [Acinetobacter sp. ANC 4654]|jgi:hypothetical protein|uniref:DUF7668 domain-containing protein n=1 Tax=Acinetobacter sp. ANC 4654 TaxID=1977872 RepID=UPI000A355F36|nr:hypothetical protein [Acinetobacter sp. ANC 4654]OTG97337.1 hypothetical protein B9T24_04245 [Acinetobacter sp. ANC 4654]
MTQNIPVPYDSEFQSPIPSIWKDCIIQIVEAFKDKDLARLNTLPSVQRIDLAYASKIAENIDAYGAHLMSLAEESWHTSVCIYMENESWKAIIDLFTVEEGRSDLIIDLFIFKKENQFIFQINNIYVP